MRIANLLGRLVVVKGDGVIDVEKTSDGHFSSDAASIFDRWGEFTEWVNAGLSADRESLDVHDLGAPSPAPRQIFAVGANYSDHVAEAGLKMPSTITVFTKFQSCLTGPYADLPLPSASVDWEAELVVVIAREARNVDAGSAWDHVAGVTLGQDYSERAVQKSSSQFSLAKSYPAFGPTGPWLVTADELEDPDDIAIECSINGEIVQEGRTSEMVFPVREIIARLSKTCTLFPGDVIFTGTMAGVGIGRKPPRFLAVGDEVTTCIKGLGSMSNRCVAGR
jgi:2-keto-4-pentenoate hydratase/2-oxohepta-3-ene-1,7-dioic acid hydratase in catechol pathway